MFAALNLLLSGFGISAYVVARAYVTFVLKTPAARAAPDLPHRGELV